MNTQIIWKDKTKTFYHKGSKIVTKKLITQGEFISLCNEHFIDPYLIQDDLKDVNSNWYTMTPEEVETFLNERY
jgi:hypothetical protein